MGVVETAVMWLRIDGALAGKHCRTAPELLSRRCRRANDILTASFHGLCDSSYNLLEAIQFMPMCGCWPRCVTLRRLLRCLWE